MDTGITFVMKNIQRTVVLEKIAALQFHEKVIGG
jgi:hypothetical protein